MFIRNGCVFWFERYCNTNPNIGECVDRICCKIILFDNYLTKYSVSLKMNIGMRLLICKVEINVNESFYVCLARHIWKLYFIHIYVCATNDVLIFLYTYIPPCSILNSRFRYHIKWQNRRLCFLGKYFEFDVNKPDSYVKIKLKK